MLNGHAVLPAKLAKQGSQPTVLLVTNVRRTGTYSPST
jgi:hypothetical protein